MGMAAAVVGGSALLGGAASAWGNKKASEASERESRKARQATEAASGQARADVMSLFPSAQFSAQQGYQNALDMFKRSLPAQTQAFQQGNVGAQQAILAGLPQIQNAILGQQVDYSAFQPRAVDFDVRSILSGIPNLSAQKAAQITPTLNIGSGPASQTVPGLAKMLPQMLLNNPQYLNAARGLVK